MKKYAVFHHAKEIAENATEKTQNKLSNAQNLAAEKYNIIAKVSIKYIISKVTQKFLILFHRFLYISATNVF